MPDNPSEIDYPPGFSLERHEDEATITFWSEEHLEPVAETLDADQLRRLGTDAQRMAAAMKDGTPPVRHPCSSAAEGAARRIMRDVEDGHLTLWLHARGHVASDRAHSGPGLNYARYWGWLVQEAPGLGAGAKRLVPAEGWPKGASRG